MSPRAQDEAVVGKQQPQRVQGEYALHARRRVFVPAWSQDPRGQAGLIAELDQTQAASFSQRTNERERTSDILEMIDDLQQNRCIELLAGLELLELGRTNVEAEFTHGICRHRRVWFDADAAAAGLDKP